MSSRWRTRYSQALRRRQERRLDGAKGLRAAVRDVCGAGAEVQRCQWHKRENVVSYLAKQDQPVWRRKLQAAWAHPAYADARRALDRHARALPCPYVKCTRYFETMRQRPERDERIRFHMPFHGSYTGTPRRAQAARLW